MQLTQHSEMFSSSTLLFVTVVVSLHFCLRPYFTPRWHFGVTDKTCPSSFCIFRAGLRGGVRKWRWKRALGRRVYRFTVDTSRGSPQSRVSSDTQRDNGMLSKYFKKLRAAPPYTPPPLPFSDTHSAIVGDLKVGRSFAMREKGSGGEEHDGVGVEE